MGPWGIGFTHSQSSRTPGEMDRRFDSFLTATNTTFINGISAFIYRIKQVILHCGIGNIYLLGRFFTTASMA